MFTTDGSVTYDAFRRRCASHTVLETISNKWVYLVICALRAGGTMRFSDLQRKIEGVSPKMLTQTLRNLERDGLVGRIVHPTVPPHVDYDLTELGENLAGLLDQIRRWSETHVPEILAARARAEGG